MGSIWPSGHIVIFIIKKSILGVFPTKLNFPLNRYSAPLYLKQIYLELIVFHSIVSVNGDGVRNRSVFTHGLCFKLITFKSVGNFSLWEFPPLSPCTLSQATQRYSKKIPFYHIKCNQMKVLLFSAWKTFRCLKEPQYTGGGGYGKQTCDAFQCIGFV